MKLLGLVTAAESGGTATEMAIEAAVGLVFGVVGASVLLAMPGYILISAATRGRGEKTEASEREFIAKTAAGGITVHVIWLPWTLSLASELQAAAGQDAWDYFFWLPAVAWVVVVLIATPVVLGMSLALLLQIESPRWLATFLSWVGVSRKVRASDAWSWIAAQQAGWVRVWVKRDNETIPIWGKYGRGSGAGIDNNRDLYLEEVWETDPDQWIGSILPNTKGIWISADSITAVEYFEGSD